MLQKRNNSETFQCYDQIQLKLISKLQKVRVLLTYFETCHMTIFSVTIFNSLLIFFSLLRFGLTMTLLARD